MFGRKKVKKQYDDQDRYEYDLGNDGENPYLSARKEYGDRYGAAVNEAARWRQISLFLLFLSLAFGGMMIWLANQNKVVPYVVQIDKQGYSVAIRAAEESQATDNRVVIATLSQFIQNFKSVVTDPRAQRKMVNDVYNYVAKGSAAEASITHYYTEHNPFQMPNTNVEVEIDSVLGVGEGGTSWQILWVERLYENGTLDNSTEWRAIATISVSPVQDVSEIMKNPLGIYVKEISMAQDLINAGNN
ncbi:MAG: conjugal transfer protein TrbF [Synergistaceae bacterium]|nr:conjugal transfer protein TrbF [Synergistaceae bacterium]